MRFESLVLRAFGPFTDETLDLSGGPPGGLHVIYGPNEAGKSTSLRAVTSFLFGFPHRTTDAHVHPQNRLAVGAVVSGEGSRHELFRLKRRKDDLVDAQGESVVTNPLPALLSHLDERSFTSRFGLDQVELERGAEALLGGSEQGLFAAGTAGAQARQVLESLAQGADDLFLARGKVPRLNRALLAHEQASREARRAERPPEKWIEQKRAYEEAQARVLRMRKERTEVRAELRRLNRLRAVMSELRDWESSRVRREQLGDIPRLPENASELRAAAERAIEASRIEARRISQEIATFEQELSTLPPESPLVTVDDEQLQLSTRVGTALSARKDLPKREASLLEQVRQVRQLLLELGLSPRSGEELQKAREMMVSARTSAVVRRLLTEHGALVTAAQEARLSFERQAAEVERLASESEDAHDPSDTLSELEAALADAQAEQGLPRQLNERKASLVALRLEMSDLSAELGESDLSAALDAALPSRAQARELSQAYREVSALIQQKRADLSRLSEQKALLECRSGGAAWADLPSVEKLATARQTRDAHLIDLTVSAEKSAVPAASLLQLSSLVGAADHLADRLRSEAERVAEAQALGREVEQLAAQIARATESLEVSEARERELRERFLARLSTLGVNSPGSPADAEGVVEALRKYVGLEKRLRAETQAVAEGEARLLQVCEKLKRALVSAPEDSDLAGLVAAALGQSREALAARTRKKQRQEAWIRATAGLSDIQARHEAAARELAAWQENWAQAVRPLGLSPQAPIALAEETLGAFEKIARILDVATNLEGRILGMQRDTEGLAHDVREVLKRHLPGLLEVDPVDAAVQLQEAIRASRKVSEERTRYKRLIAERRVALSEVEVRRAAAEGQLEQLVRQAEVESASDLPLAEERREEIRRLEQKLLGLEKNLLDAAEGASIEQLKVEAEQWRGRGQLIERVDELETQSQELEEELKAAERDETGTRLGLDTYRSVDVVEARQFASGRASEAAFTLREYLVLKAAHRMLAGQIEKYAARFAGPIAGRAGDIFRRMTLGRYSTLRVGVGERTLRCVRDGQELEVSALSRGTRAQLYFSLRLASLESYFEEHDAVPLVFDDLFVDFDDDRTTAAFEILSELAGRVQVLYFTHLARDVEAAHDAVPQHLLFTHRLGAA